MTATEAKKDEGLTKALIKSAKNLGLTLEETGQIIGTSEKNIEGGIKHNSKSGQRVVMLVWCSRELLNLCGGDDEWAKHFFNSENHLTGGTPSQQVKTSTGLELVTQTIEYLCE